MRLRNSLRLILVLFLLRCVVVEAQSNAPPQAPPRSSQPAATPSQTEAPPPDQKPSSGQEPGTEPGGFVFHADVQEVVLHATVIDDKQRMVTNLDKNAFTRI